MKLSLARFNSIGYYKRGRMVKLKYHNVAFEDVWTCFLFTREESHNTVSDVFNLVIDFKGYACLFHHTVLYTDNHYQISVAK